VSALPGELGPEEAKEFRDTGKYGGEEHTQKGAECAERSSQIHVLVVSAENGGKQLSQPRIPPCFRGHSGTLAQPTDTPLAQNGSVVNESERSHLRDERKRLRVEYAELFAGLTEILARSDLMGIAELGPRANAYEPEVGTILPRLRDATDAADVQRILHEEFVRWFDADILPPQAEFAAPAAEIWTLWLRHGTSGAL
jgi:hypothetical protein